MNKILFCGTGYGAGNIGDDAILSGLLISARAYLREDTKYGALTFNPDFTKRITEIDEVFHFEHAVAAAFNWATHIVLGGATVLTAGFFIGHCLGLTNKAKAVNKPICMLAVGTSIEPDEFQKGQLKKYFDSLGVITLRSEADRKCVIDWGLPSDKLRVCADGAFAIECEDASHTSSNIMGISLVNEHFTRHYPYVDTFTKYLSNPSTEMKPYFICNETRQEDCYDYGVLRRLHEQFGGDFFCRYVPYQESLRELAKCRLVITMRMHIMIFCSLIGVPCIPLIREPKLKLMFNSLGLKTFLPLDFSVSDLDEAINSVNKHPELGLPDAEKLADLKRRALENGEVLHSWMRGEYEKAV